MLFPPCKLITESETVAFSVIKKCKIIPVDLGIILQQSIHYLTNTFFTFTLPSTIYLTK